MQNKKNNQIYKNILQTELELYLSTLYENRRSKYVIKKSSLLHNYITKYSPDKHDIMMFCDLLYGNLEETKQQIYDRTGL